MTDLRFFGGPLDGKLERVLTIPTEYYIYIQPETEIKFEYKMVELLSDNKKIVYSCLHKE